MTETRPHTIVIGAGFGGLAAAIRRCVAGDRVTLLEAAATPGGKARTVPSAAGPVDAGPTVLTMRWVFDELARVAGTKLEEIVTLQPEPILARHWWPDGTTLDLHVDPDASREAIEEFAGRGDAEAFWAFRSEAATLFEAFRGPMMETANPSLPELGAVALRNPSMLTSLLPTATLEKRLAARFRDQRLQQLFGRYATYVGGAPGRSPGLLSLIWRAEEHGVWRVEGGMQRLAAAFAGIVEKLGGRIVYESPVAQIETDSGRAAAVVTRSGMRLRADQIIFAGDPRALTRGLLGTGVDRAVQRRAVEPRSLSARVWSFAAEAHGPELLHHNVFFGPDPKAEFDSIANGQIPHDATLYVCAEDRGAGLTPPRLERFEIIENAAPEGGRTEDPTECRTRTFQTLAARGLTFTPTPGTETVSMPETFARLFPGSAGSLYGRSPHGALAALARPRARTAVRGLYLAGGGVHPGAGVPMATLSGRHAAETIERDRTSTSASHPTAMRGGTSTVSPTMGPGPSRSSPS